MATMLPLKREDIARLGQTVMSRPGAVVGSAILGFAGVLALVFDAWIAAAGLAGGAVALAAGALTGHAGGREPSRVADRAGPSDGLTAAKPRTDADLMPYAVVGAPRGARRPVDAGDGRAAWRSLLDALPDPALVVDNDHNVIHANAAAHTLFPAMQRGRPIALASRQPELGDALGHVIETGERRSVQLHERLPVERRLDVALAPLRGLAGAQSVVLLVLHDISERDRLAQMRADFIAHASHELRTPLASLKGFIETLLGPARNDAASRERFLGIMAAESARMTRLLDDLLSLSRVEMRAHIMPTGRIDLADPIGEVLELMEPVAREAGVMLHYAAGGGSRVIRADHDEIVQVLVNLLQNAIKYGRPEGHVEVSVSDHRVGGRAVVRIAVKDDGPGIAEEHLPRLTERFYRVDDRTSRAKGGTGLGLAIVKHILNRHGGELRIASVVGKGSTFAVELPLLGDE